MIRLTLVAAALALLGPGLVAAAPAGEEAFEIDLSSLPRGGIYYIKCSNGTNLAQCGIASLWEQANEAPRLQTERVVFHGALMQPDHKLLG